MESIVVGVLFVYPGAIIELLFRRYAKYGYKEEEHAESLKLAELFLNSAIVTILTVILFQFFTDAEMNTLSSLIFELNRFESFLRYLILSIAVTCVTAWIRYKVSGMDPKGDGGLDQRRVNGCHVAGAPNAWRELVFGEALKEILEHCVVRITTSEGMTAGFAVYLPDDFEKGILLDQTGFVEKQFRDEVEWEPEQRWLGNPHAVYIDPLTGIKVEFFDGKELYEYLAQ